MDGGYKLADNSTIDILNSVTMGAILIVTHVEQLWSTLSCGI